MSTKTETREPGDPYVLEDLTEEEAYLFAILSDLSGLDQAEFLWYAPDHPDDCFRAWDYQWSWWRCTDQYQIEQNARSTGKSLSIKVRGCAFCLLFPGQEMVITAPELIHLEPIVSLIESQMYSTWFLREFIPRGKSAVTHRPFQMNFLNNARIIGRIPQRDGKGVKGCACIDTEVLTSEGIKMVQDVKPGDLVLTHRNRWKPVVWVEEDVNDCYEVRGQGSFPLRVSCDHRFWGAENQAGPKQKRDFLPLGFHDVETLIDHQVYWATPTEFPRLEVPTVEAFGTANQVDADSEEFWWLVGRYLADGFLSMDKKNNKGRRVNWVVHPDDQDDVWSRVVAVGLKPVEQVRAHSSANVVMAASAGFYRWLCEYFGERCDGKKLPAFALGMSEPHRKALLRGYLAGDGHYNIERSRWGLGTASKTLAVGLQLLAQSVGYTVNCSSVQPKVTHINGVKLKSEPKVSWRLQLAHGHPSDIEHCLVGKVKSVVPIGKQPVYNLIVDEDHSYMTGSIMSHNLHPVWLELDEAQDYPKQGWKELTETLKRGMSGSVWRAHGVTRGVRDDFYEKTQDSPTNHWRVHRYPAMWRPTWTDKERQDAIAEYGSRDDPDYRRNVLGEHGDATNPIFVAAQLHRNVDQDPLSEYNTAEYFKQVIKSEELELLRVDINHFLDFPQGHLSFVGSMQEREQVRAGKKAAKAIYWVGMDVGFTIDPSEILVYVEYHPPKPTRDRPNVPNPQNGQTALKLLTRLSLWRMPIEQQLLAMLTVIDFYRPKVFALDKNGIGHPMWQLLQAYLEHFKAGDLDKIPKWFHGFDLEHAATTIKGYSFGEKLVVGIDKTVELKRTDDPFEKAAERREAKDFSTDVLREFVDGQRLWLPWDDEFLKQFQAATWSMNSGRIDQYGRRQFNKGNDHCLDASREMALGYVQFSIEELMNKPKKHVPIQVEWLSDLG